LLLRMAADERGICAGKVFGHKHVLVGTFLYCYNKLPINTTTVLFSKLVEESKMVAVNVPRLLWCMKSFGLDQRCECVLNMAAEQ
jgi:hypothetical protein